MSEAEPVSAETLARQDGRMLSQTVWIGAGVGVIGLGASVALAAGQGAQFYFSWLVAYLYFLSIGLGSLFLVFCFFICHAGWSVTLRRILENTMATLPVFAVLFIPIWLGRHELYVWTDPAEVAKEAALQGKSGYLNETFWLIRAVFYFLCWGGLAIYFSRESQRQDQTGDESITRRLQRVAAPGMVIFAFTISFAAIDWMMSLEPEWFSTIYGVYYFAGSTLAALAFLVLGIAFVHARGGLRGVVTVEHTQDVGKLLFGFTIFWTYIAFSQYFLIWYGNIPEETLYYMHRAQGSWPTVAAVLIFGHFAIPFFFLMPRAIKRSMPLLSAGALWLLAMHYMDIYWCVMPALRHESARPGLLDGATMLAIGGFFLAWLGWVSSRRALVPMRDPRLMESLSFENV